VGVMVYALMHRAAHKRQLADQSALV
jgi:hypothetical protein